MNLKKNWRSKKNQSQKISRTIKIQSQQSSELDNFRVR